MPAVEVTATRMSASVSDLSGYAEQLKHDLAAYGQVERNAAFLAIRVGMVLNRVKLSLPHGQLWKWVEGNVGNYVERHLRRFMTLAEKFIAEHNLKPAQLSAISEADAQKASPATQLVMDFIGGRSQAELFAEYGIAVKDKKPMGGARVAMVKKLSGDELKQFIIARDEREWADVLKRLNDLGLTSFAYTRLTRVQLESVLGTFEMVAERIRAHLRNVPNKPNAREVLTETY